MCTAHYTEEVLLICEWETDKQSCPKYRWRFGWWGVFGERNENQVAVTKWSSFILFQLEPHSWDLKSPYCAIFTFNEFNLKIGQAPRWWFQSQSTFQAPRRCNKVADGQRARYCLIQAATVGTEKDQISRICKLLISLWKSIQISDIVCSFYTHFLTHSL